MVRRGRVKGGVIVLDEPAALPEGTAVEVQPVEEPKPVEQAEDPELADLRQTLLQWAGKAQGLPPDMASNHDHYLHGRPKS